MCLAIVAIYVRADDLELLCSSWNVHRTTWAWRSFLTAMASVHVLTNMLIMLCASTFMSLDDNDAADVILNALSGVFLLDLDNLVYDVLLTEAEKEEHEEMPMNETIPANRPNWYANWHFFVNIVSGTNMLVTSVFGGYGKYILTLCFVIRLFLWEVFHASVQTPLVRKRARVLTYAFAHIGSALACNFMSLCMNNMEPFVMLYSARAHPGHEHDSLHPCLAAFKTLAPKICTPIL